ncbi:MAG: glycoside hydrolase family 95 protein [Phycisphaeraceae bacterium]|nr:glycoside hydrolase family 95 protein [Phycisphaeraceae bacterium]
MARVWIGVLAAMSAIQARAQDADILWYSRPASTWTEALPIGNGRLGAMVFGGVDAERIQLNEETIWAGPPVPRHPEGLEAALADARGAFARGDNAEGQRIIAERFMAPRISPRSYQTLGDLNLRFHHERGAPPVPIELTGWKRGPNLPRPDLAQLDPAFDARWPEIADAGGIVLPERTTATFRVEFDLTEAQARDYDELRLGPIDDDSIIVLNGVEVGQTHDWSKPSRHSIAAGVRPGRNVLCIAASNVGGPGNFTRETLLASSGVPRVYARHLNLERALSVVEYKLGGVGYRREMFASHPDGVIVMRLTASRPGSIDFDAWLSRPEGALGYSSSAERLVLGGRASHGTDHMGVRFNAVLDVLPEGGSMATRDRTIEVRGADSALLLIAAASDYNAEDPTTPLTRDRVRACAAQLESARAKGFDGLLGDHLDDYGPIFERCRLDLGGGPISLPTDERLRRVREGATDPGLEALLFEYGRYLLISSSRPGDLPANLQGLWSEHIEAPWNADYHLNINLQMNYWPAEATNLSDCAGPLFDYMEAMLPSGRDLARQMGCRGVTMGHEADVWLWTGLTGQPVWGMWPHAAGWMSRHFYEHWRFTNDEAFLRERAFPFLRECALFYLDWLTPDESGRLVSGPSTSPENTYVLGGKRLSLSMGGSMDQQIIADVFDMVIEAGEAIGSEDAALEDVRAARARLAPGIVVGDDGRLREWAQPYQEAEPGHRHMSHLYALHPGDDITRSSPEAFQAARRSIEARLAQGGGHTGWSRAWLINFFARLGDGDQAHENIRLLLAKSTLPNLFDDHPPFQIDGNFGATAGIAEMLLQSHADRLEFLPALPAAWPRGNIKGLVARAGIVVDLSWDEGRLTSASLRPSSDQSISIRLPESAQGALFSSDRHAEQQWFEDRLELRLHMGQEYLLTFTRWPAATP